MERSCLNRIEKAFAISFVALVSTCLYGSMEMHTHEEHGMGGHGMEEHVEHSHHMALIMKLIDYSLVDVTSVKNGKWSDPDTWDSGVPQEGDRVLVSMGHTVTIDTEISERIMTVRSDGHLKFATDVNTSLNVHTLVVTEMGSLTMGTESDPVSQGLTAKIVIDDLTGQGIQAYLNEDGSEPSDYDPLQVGLGLISMGPVRMHGAAKTYGSALAQEPEAEDIELILDVVPNNWNVGDTIVVAGTSRDALGDEQRTIAGISGNVITLDHQLEKSHKTPNTDLSEGTILKRMKVHVVNLTRNVYVETEESGRAKFPDTAEDTLRFNRRGHVMIMHSNDADIKYAGFYYLGRSNKIKKAKDTKLAEDGSILVDETDGSLVIGTNPRARYSLHFHHGGFDTPAATIYGSVVVDSPGWGFVNHSSHVKFKHNVAYDVKAASFVTEAGDEIGSFIENISIRNDIDEYANDSGDLRFQRRKNGNEDDEFGYGGHGFWLQGINVDVERNVVSGAGREGMSLYPLKLAGRLNDRFPKSLVQDADKYDPWRDDVNVTSVPARLFEGNIVYGSNIGLMVAEHRPQFPSRVQNFFAWRINMGLSSNYSDDISYENTVLLGDLDYPAGLGHFAHHGTGNVEFVNPYVEGFALGIQIPRDGNSGTEESEGSLNDFTGFKYTRLEGGYYNNYINLHYPLVRSHMPLLVEIINPEFGTLTASAQSYGLAKLAYLHPDPDIDIDSSNSDSNGFGELMERVNDGSIAKPYNYLLHDTALPYAKHGTGTHMRDESLAHRFILENSDGERYQLFLRDIQDPDHVPYDYVVNYPEYDWEKNANKLGSDGELFSLDPDKLTYKSFDTRRLYPVGVGLEIPKAYYYLTNEEINDFYQKNAEIDVYQSVFLPGDPENYPTGAASQAGFMLPRGYESLSRYEEWNDAYNVVAMRIDDLPAYKTYLEEPNKPVVNFDFEFSENRLKYRLDKPAATPVNYLDVESRIVDMDALGHAMYFDGRLDALDFEQPFPIAYKTFAVVANIRPMDTSSGVIAEWGDADVGYQLAIENGEIVASLRTQPGQTIELREGSLIAGQWHQVILSYNFGHNKAYLYVDGDRDVKGNTIADVLVTENMKMGLGRVGRGQGAFTRSGAYRGFIDDLRILERSFTDHGADQYYGEFAFPIKNQSNLDLDGDGYLDVADAFPLDSAEFQDADNDGFGDAFADTNSNDSTTPDYDGDGVVDALDAAPDDSNAWSDLDEDGTPDRYDSNIDGDLYANSIDALPYDPTEYQDSDGDGVGNIADVFDKDPFEWYDSDKDNLGNNADALDYNPNETIDTDGDGYGDNQDKYPFSRYLALEGNFLEGRNMGADDGMNGWAKSGPSSGTVVATSDDSFSGSQSFVLSNDDGENLDLRMDWSAGDVEFGDPNVLIYNLSGWVKMDSPSDNGKVEIISKLGNGGTPSGAINYTGYGTKETEETEGTDRWEYFSFDFEGDFTKIRSFIFRNADGGLTVNVDDLSVGILRHNQGNLDGDYLPDYIDPDDDGDGFLDGEDAFPRDASEQLDTDGDTVGNNADDDDDGDGFFDYEDAFPLDASEHLDTDGDGVGNNADNDDDNDGITDSEDAEPLVANTSADPDFDKDQTPDHLDSNIDGDSHENDVDVFDYDPDEWLDSDQDGWGDNSDTHPLSPYFGMGGDVNYIANGDFEDPDLGGWKIGGSGGTMEFVEDETDGVIYNVLRVDNPEGSKVDLSSKSTGPAFSTPTTVLNFSGWYKASMPYESGKVLLRTKISGSESLSRSFKLDYIDDSWNYFSIDIVATTGDFKSMRRFQVRTQQAGLTLWLDDLAVHYVTDYVDTDGDGEPDFMDSDDDDDGLLDGEDPDRLNP
ncbi:MAG: G8 domain-containing protein [Opitutales bacterium]